MLTSQWNQFNYQMEIADIKTRHNVKVIIKVLQFKIKIINNKIKIHISITNFKRNYIKTLIMGINKMETKVDMVDIKV